MYSVIYFLLPDRQSAYASHDNVGATSSSFLPSASASTLEKAGELIRQAVKQQSESATDNATNTVASAAKRLFTTDSSKPSTETTSSSTSDKQSESETLTKDTSDLVCKDSTSVSVTATTSAKLNDTDASKPGSIPSEKDISDAKSSQCNTPEKRGVKR